MAQYADQYNSDGAGYEVIVPRITWTDSTYPGDYRDWPSRVLGLPKFIFLPGKNAFTASGRGSSTYICDRMFFVQSETTNSALGGNWPDGSGAGMFLRMLYHSPNDTVPYIGSRLVYKHVEGEGA